MTAARLDGWIGGQSWSRTTRAKVLVSLRAFSMFGIDQGWCRRSPVVGIAVDRHPSGPQPRSPRTVVWAQAIEDYLVWLRAGGRCAGTMKVRRWHLFDLSELHADPSRVTTDDLAVAVPAGTRP